MNDDRLYAFVLRGELTKTALWKTDVISKHASSEALVQEYIKILSLDLLDDECVNVSKPMATVYTAISAFENMVRRFISTTLLEYKGEDWWQTSVSERIRKLAESRRNDEEKIKWHTQRGDSMINYTEFGDLVSIMQQNLEYFEPHIVSIDWARQIMQTLERSRNVIMHSGELGHRDVERIGTNIRDWISQVGS